MIHVTIFNEFYHEQHTPAAREVHPNGIHGTLKAYLDQFEDIAVTVATQDMPDCGLPTEVLDNTDVLIWWGHWRHGEISDALAVNIQERVLRGMGFIALHSAHQCKPFRLLMGTSGCLNWRDDDFERLWTILPTHPIAQGVPPYIDLELEEMYGEVFDIPQPDETVFLGWYRGGEVFRSGCTWYRGRGKVFYLQPGHETNWSLHNPHIQRIILNAVRWAYTQDRLSKLGCDYIPHDKTPEALAVKGS